jgi:hypothetical protein
MKTTLILLSLLASALVSSAQFDSAQYRGDYFGVLVPVGNDCSNERLVIGMTVAADGSLSGYVDDWEANERNTITGQVLYRGRLSVTTGSLPGDPGWNPFDSRHDWRIVGLASSKAGTIRGSVDARAAGGCRYTFTVFRRFKSPQ